MTVAPAVLLVVFNRPETVWPVLRALREVRPPRVYVAQDAPRVTEPSDVERCAQVRGAVKTIDWTNEVYHLVQETNRGFSRATESAIRWFFETEERGIVLEDDCLIGPAFYQFAEELLALYADAPQVRLIAGHNPLGALSGPDGYFLTSTPYIWGWATWRAKWLPFDSSIPSWRDPIVKARVASRMNPQYFRSMERYWRRIASGNIESWDLALHFDLLASGHGAVMPTRNLVTNIGFGDGSTNSPVGWPREYRQTRYDDFRIVAHPSELIASSELETEIWANRFPVSRRLGEILPVPVRRVVRRIAARPDAYGYAAMRRRVLETDDLA